MTFLNFIYLVYVIHILGIWHFVFTWNLSPCHMSGYTKHIGIIYWQYFLLCILSGFRGQYHSRPAPTTLDIPQDDRPDPNDMEDFELPDHNALLEGICTSVWQQCVQQRIAAKTNLINLPNFSKIGTSISRSLLNIKTIWLIWFKNFSKFSKLNIVFLKSYFLIKSSLLSLELFSSKLLPL